MITWAAATNNNIMDRARANESCSDRVWLKVLGAEFVIKLKRHKDDKFALTGLQDSPAGKFWDLAQMVYANSTVANSIDHWPMPSVESLLQLPRLQASSPYQLGPTHLLSYERDQADWFRQNNCSHHCFALADAYLPRTSDDGRVPLLLRAIVAAVFAAAWTVHRLAKSFVGRPFASVSW